jgi:hypothetical protein
VEYRFVYMSYTHRQLLSKQKSEGRLGYDDSSKPKIMVEAEDWSRGLNEAAEEGFSVKESGVMQIEDSVVLWALLSKT